MTTMLIFWIFIYTRMMGSQLTHTGFSRVLCPTSVYAAWEGLGRRRTVVALAWFNWQLSASVLHFGPMQFVSECKWNFCNVSHSLNSLLSSSVCVCYAQRVSNVSPSFVVPPSPEPRTFVTHSANTDLTLPAKVFVHFCIFSSPAHPSYWTLIHFLTVCFLTRACLSLSHKSQIITKKWQVTHCICQLYVRLTKWAICNQSTLDCLHMRLMPVYRLTKPFY